MVKRSTSGASLDSNSDRRLALRAEMKLPGEALIEFRIEACGKHYCTLQQRALFQPRGLLGLLYWYAVAPLHHIVFRSMLLGICREAVEIARQSEPVKVA